MIEIVVHVARETAQVVLLVFAMMLLVDLLSVWTRGKITAILRGSRPWKQYVVAPLLAAAPGCAGGFSVVSLYMHGVISFGPLAGAMLAASGDEAFVMLALFPEQAVRLFAVLAVGGMLWGWIADRIVRTLRIRTCEECPDRTSAMAHKGLRHYLRNHVWDHIVRRHLWRTALWTFGAVLLVEVGFGFVDLSGLASRYPLVLLGAAGLLGLIPESGPHMIFVTLFANQLVPFSVLLTSAIVQDGHGMLPLYAHSVRASLVLKALNLTIGLAAGGVAYAMGF